MTVREVLLLVALATLVVSVVVGFAVPGTIPIDSIVVAGAFLLGRAIHGGSHHRR